MPPSSSKRSRHPQSQSHEQQQLEFNGLVIHTSELREPNCCTWKVATAFLFLVAALLVTAWIALPAEDIVAKYIPTFDEPANPYTGPEAGENVAVAGDGGSGQTTTASDGGEDETSGVGTYVPPFMQCPNGQEQQQCCNGSVDNCVLRVDQMMFGLVHNAMASEEKGFIVGYNHQLGISKALMAGYRGLSLDVCNCNGMIQFCHNVCDLGERVPNEVFTNMVQFLNDYPSEVVVLLFEASTEKGPIVWNNLYDEMSTVDGFSDMIYVHTYGNAWPTMGTLVSQNKRIIVFYMNGGTCTNNACPLGFYYFYNYAKETQYQSASLDELQNYSYSCEVTRGPEAGAPFPATFFAVNNFVTPPDVDASTIANSQDSLSSLLNKCANINGVRPNFVYLDFWNVGVTAQAVQYMNSQSAQQLGEE